MSRETRLIMGMPITIELAGRAPAGLMAEVFAYFDAVDKRFSTYKPESEISQYNRGEIPRSNLSAEMHEVLQLAERTKNETDGYFDIKRADGSIDPSGIVKGWAIRNAAQLILRAGVADFYVDAGGDIQTGGKTASGEEWTIGIRNPFQDDEIIKIVTPKGHGIATSGSYVRGQHIYNPHRPASPLNEIVSLTVLAKDVLEADRFATAAFAMGRDGIYFLEKTPGLEGYCVDAKGIALQTRGFGDFLCV